MNKSSPYKFLIIVWLLVYGCTLFLAAGCTPVPPQEMPKTRDIDLADIRSRIKKTPRSSILLEQEEGLQEERKASVSSDFVKGDWENQALLHVKQAESGKDVPPAAGKEQEGDGIALNFDNADIYEVIHVIGDMLKLNYIIDPEVKGVVNIRSSKEIPISQLQEVFLKILHINGLDLRDEGGHSYIFVSSKPYSGTLSTVDDIKDLKPGSRIVLQIVPLLNLQADESIKLVEPYLSPKGSIQVLENHNWLLVHDYETNVVDILTILSQLDVSPLSSLKIRLVRVQNAPIEEIKTELTEIFTALHINKKDSGSLNIVPLGQVNSLLLVSPSEFLVENAARWIKELDITVGSDRDNIYIYNARNTVASELAGLVTRLITEESDVVSAKTVKSKKGTDRKAVSKQKTKKENAGPLASLRFAGTPKLIADDTRNIVIIRALPPDYSRLVKLLERLDNLPRQVLVEVIVAEVFLKDELAFGVEWAIENNKLGWNNGTEYTMDVASTVFTAENSLSTGLSLLINSGDDVAALLHALASTTNLSILSSPQILVLNNETATVNVGEEVPIVTSVTENNASAEKVDKTIQYKDTGVILTVTPQINYDGVILLDLQQTISKAMAVPENGVQSAPIRKRELKTKLAVKDGQSILIGGLIGTDKSVSNSGVPFFKDIPFLGYLFKYESQKLEKTELLVMVTVYVIESEQVLDQYIDEFKVTMDGFRDELHSKEPEE
jgi:general secretion pathway protein D